MEKYYNISQQSGITNQNYLSIANYNNQMIHPRSPLNFSQLAPKSSKNNSQEGSPYPEPIPYLELYFD
jgi:LysM repeat protein